MPQRERLGKLAPRKLWTLVLALKIKAVQIMQSLLFLNARTML